VRFSHRRKSLQFLLCTGDCKAQDVSIDSYSLVVVHWKKKNPNRKEGHILRSAVRVEEEADWDSGLVALSLVVSAVWEVIVKKEERRGRRERPT